MSRAQTIDMTKGRIIPLTLRFALPLCVGSILQQMYMIADTMVVGNFCSPVSLAALGTSGQPVEIMLMLFIGVGSGASILVAQYTGSRQGDRLAATVASAVKFLYLSAIPVSIAGVLVGPLILRGMGVPADTFEYARTYMSILFAGTLANMGYNLNAGILRGLGDSRSTLRFLVVSCLLNIALDLVLVAGLRMDVAGAALATVISQFVAWGLSAAYIRKKYPELGYTLLPRRVPAGSMREILRIGVPLGVNNSLYSVGHLLMQTLINAQGSDFIAACAVAGKVCGMANMMIASLSTAATTYSGQNYGAKQYARVRRGVLIPVFSGAVTLCAGLVVTAFAAPLVALFTKDAQVASFAVLYIRVVLPFTWCYAVFNGLIMLANGIGEVRYPTFVNLFMLLGVRIPTGYLIGRIFGGQYVMAGVSVSFVFGLLAMTAFFFGGKWRAVGQKAKAQAAQSCGQS